MHPDISSTQTLCNMTEFTADDFGLTPDEYRDLDGCKVVVVSLQCGENYFNVIVVDRNFEIFGLSDYHLGFDTAPF